MAGTLGSSGRKERLWCLSDPGRNCSVFAGGTWTGHFDDPAGGALFFEIIQREGDDGFGGGNFRALFETIEQDQIALEKTAKQMPLELI